jgi:hypothetical protein
MEGPKVLKRTITPEIRASRERDMETVLDNYRENLRGHGVTDEAAIECFVSEERSKMQKEYESLDNGDCSSNIYHTPTDWEGIASGMKDQELEAEEEMSM